MEPAGVGLGHADYNEVTRAVDALPLVLKACVIEYYQRNAGAEEAASRLGIKKGVMFKYLHSAHEHIGVYFDSVAIGG